MLSVTTVVDKEKENRDELGRERARISLSASSSSEEDNVAKKLFSQLMSMYIFVRSTCRATKVRIIILIGWRNIVVGLDC